MDEKNIIQNETNIVVDPITKLFNLSLASMLKVISAIPIPEQHVSIDANKLIIIKLFKSSVDYPQS